MFQLLLAAALAAPMASAAPPSEPAVASQDFQSRLAVARQVVDLIHPTPQMIDSNVRSWEAVARKQAQSDPAMAKLEAEYPGVIEASIKASRPIALEFSQKFVRDAKVTKSQILAERLTISEMREVQQFFSTPAGQRFLGQMMGKADMNKLADELAASSPDVAAEDNVKGAVDKTMRSTLTGVIGDTSADDVLEIMKFEAKPSAGKFAEAGQAADAALIKILMNPDPDLIARYREASTKAAVEFVEARRAGGAK